MVILISLIEYMDTIDQFNTCQYFLRQFSQQGNASLLPTRNKYNKQNFKTAEFRYRIMSECHSIIDDFTSLGFDRL